MSSLWDYCPDQSLIIILFFLYMFVGQGQTSVRRRSAVLFHRHVFNGHHATQVQCDILLVDGRRDVLDHVHNALLVDRPLPFDQHGKVL